MAVQVITLSISVQFNLDQDHRTCMTMMQTLVKIIKAWNIQINLD